ncbi:MAG: cupredoxin domain-containing protein [Thermoanaerobaculia bacterium]
MRIRPLFVFSFLLLTIPSIASAKDVYLAIAGSVGVFRTDARIFNPSGTKDITITATFLPAGQDNSGAQSKTIPVLKRQMVTLNDVVTSLFQGTGLGAIRLSCPDDFVATSRIYAGLTDGTLGQFVQGLDAATAKQKGVMIQLKSSGVTGQKGTFRTNYGFVNPHNTATEVKYRIYDKSNAQVGAEVTQTVQPQSVVFPLTLDPNSANLSDGFITFTASQTVFGFSSVVDNGTTDPTFIAASEDTGSPVTPGPTTREFSVTARQWQFDIVPGGKITAKVGDTVVLRIKSADVTHGFSMPGFVSQRTLTSQEQTITFTANQAGDFIYFCTVPTCGAGHAGMDGTMTIEP